MSKEWFNRGFANLLIYTRDHEDMNIEETYITGSGYELGKWVTDIRKYWQNGQLSSKQEYLLENTGLAITGEIQNWESVYCCAKNYYMKYGTLPGNITYHTNEGIMLGAWIEKQRSFGYMLSDDQKEKLSEIGIEVQQVWET